MEEMLNIVTLILDDDKDMLELIELSLKEAKIKNYRLFHSDASFMDGLSDNMHILVIDHHLSGTVDGLDVMKRAIKKNPNVFVIAMSGNDDSKLVVEYLNEGANRFVLKNQSNYLEQLVKFVRQGINRFVKDLEFFRRQETLLNAC